MNKSFFIPHQKKRCSSSLDGQNYTISLSTALHPRNSGHSQQMTTGLCDLIQTTRLLMIKNYVLWAWCWRERMPFIMLSTVMSFCVFFVSSMMKFICKGTDCFCSVAAFEVLRLLNQCFSIFVEIKRFYWWLNYKIYLQRCDICFLMSNTCLTQSSDFFLSLSSLLKSCDLVALDEVRSPKYDGKLWHLYPQLAKGRG